jgi:gamma-glutamyltranspeptidase/glutathione hydrolase/leukotriene-C4 hydrolase
MRHHMGKKTAIATGVLVIFIIALGVLLWFAYHQGLIEEGEEHSTAAVVTTTDECTDAAVGILKRGGSAADAAICAAFCQGVTVPQASGIGGGFLATIYIKDSHTIETLNAREVAPLRATEQLYSDNSTLIREGGLSIAVPTEVKGLFELHKRHGALTWSEVIEPVIDVAEKGFKVTNYLARVLSEREAKIRSKDGFK